LAGVPVGDGMAVRSPPCRPPDHVPAETTITGMDPSRPRALRVPAIVLTGGLLLIGLVTLPAVALFVLAYLSRASGGGTWADLDELLTHVLPALIGYPLAGGLWIYCRRTRTARSAWTLAVLGLLVVAAVSFTPVAGWADVIYLQWKETQPGGRGYYE
jgi:hypothetical protein